MEELRHLLDKAQEAIRRDLTHIFTEVSARKLSPSSARDLVSYVKLLAEILEEQEEAGEELSKTSEEELKKLAKELIEKDQG